MIDRIHVLPVARQCQLLQLARSTAYSQSRPVSEMAVTLMRQIEELRLQYPFAGARMLRDLLRREGHCVGRRHVAMLMRRMGITAMTGYSKPEIFNTDQGCQFTSQEFTGLLNDHEIQIGMDGTGQRQDNVFEERLWRSLK